MERTGCQVQTDEKLPETSTFCGSAQSIVECGRRRFGIAAADSRRKISSRFVDVFRELRASRQRDVRSKKGERAKSAEIAKATRRSTNRRGGGVFRRLSSEIGWPPRRFSADAFSAGSAAVPPTARKSRRFGARTARAGRVSKAAEKAGPWPDGRAVQAATSDPASDLRVKPEPAATSRHPFYARPSKLGSQPNTPTTRRVPK